MKTNFHRTIILVAIPVLLGVLFTYTPHPTLLEMPLEGGEGETAEIMTLSGPTALMSEPAESEVGKKMADKPLDAFAALQNQDLASEPLNSPAEEQTIICRYDDVGRLREVEYADGTIITYSYDAVGNRVSTAVSLAWPAWDVNMDTNINMLDVIQVGNHWGESGDPGWIREDVNDDGNINMLDVIMIGNHWGE